VRLVHLHHVTCICSDAPRTARFYRGLGFRLVKKTVNFDDPQSYHLYFGDEGARPGTLLTFFEWPGAAPGRPGRGTLERIALVVPGEREVREVEDPDGLRLELHPGEQAGLHSVTAYGRATDYEGLVAGDQLRLVEPPAEQTFLGPGVTHHVAWRARDDEEEGAWQLELRGRGIPVTEILDRKYFHSIYFRPGDGILFEIATDGPGFAVDEPPDALGEALALPEWLEPQRATLERVLQPV
jgi:glyoxalase family protein